MVDGYFNLLNLQTVESAHSTTTHSACLMLGAGLRYALCPRFELTAEAVLNRQITSKTLSSYWVNPNIAAGVRYRFGKAL